MRISEILLAAVFAFSPMVATAQKDAAENSAESFGIFETRADYYQFMGSVKRNPEMAGMVDLINDIVLDQPIGSTNKRYGGNSSTLGILADPGVRDELGMVDFQYKELQELNADVQKRFAEQLRSLDFSDSTNVVEQIRNLRQQMEKELNDVLLPHQTQRLRQIKTRSSLRYRSLVDILTSDPVKSDLEITDDQSAELRKTEQEINEDLEKEIAELREKARKRLLSKLSRRQQDQVEDLMGDVFEFDRASSTESKSKRRAREK